MGARPLEADAKLLAELRETAALAAPIVATNLCEYAPVVIGVAFAGHLGDDKYIDAVAMGTTVRVAPCARAARGAPLTPGRRSSST